MYSTDDEISIRTLYKQLIDGWNQGSAEAFAAPFTEDADFIAFDGTHYKGCSAIISTHRLLFEQWFKGTRLVGEVLYVRFLAPDVAAIRAVGGTIPRNRSKPAPDRDAIQTLVAVKQGEDWRLALFHNTWVRPMGLDVGGTLAWMAADWLWRIFGPKKAHS